MVCFNMFVISCKRYWFVETDEHLQILVLYYKVINVRLDTEAYALVAFRTRIVSGYKHINYE
jgi:hypothetical protein